MTCCTVLGNSQLEHRLIAWINWPMRIMGITAGLTQSDIPMLELTLISCSISAAPETVASYLSEVLWKPQGALIWIQCINTSPFCKHMVHNDKEARFGKQRHDFHFFLYSLQIHCPSPSTQRDLSQVHLCLLLTPHLPLAPAASEEDLIFV